MPWSQIVLLELNPRYILEIACSQVLKSHAATFFSKRFISIMILRHLSILLYVQELNNLLNNCSALSAVK